MKSVDCPKCGNDPDGRLNCPECEGYGCLLIRECPHEMVTPEIREAVEAAEFAEKGSWPMAGGTLDQTQACLEAVRCVWSYEARAKLQLTSNGR